MSIDPKLIRRKLNEAFKSIENETGLEFKTGTIHYNESAFRVNISGTVILDKEKLFDEFAAQRDPKFVGKLNTLIKYNSQIYKIIGFNKKATKYWLMVQTINNYGPQKSYNLTGRHCKFIGR